MFGYVTVNQPELKIKEFEKYHSYYCGLCRKLNSTFGLFGRVTLNYDMVFLVMLLSDLYDEEEIVVKRRCVIHPILKHEERISCATEYASNMCVLLTYYKFLDDYNDDHTIKSKLGLIALKSKIKRIERKYEDKALFVKNKLSELSDLENAKSKELDNVAKLFGEIMGEIFKYKDDEYSDNLYRLGFFLGKFIYLLDAYEDVDSDIESGAYNPFKELSKTEDFENQVLNILMLMIGECTDSFERLPLIENAEILRNILYSGVWSRYKKRKETVDNESI